MNRFEFQNQDKHLNIVYDNQKGGVIFNEDIVDLLNELYEENQDLKKILKEILLETRIKKQLLNTICQITVQITPKQYKTINELLTTNTKRFKNKNGCVIDTEKKIGTRVLDTNEVVEILNKLYDNTKKE